jgi:hypothetical protein
MSCDCTRLAYGARLMLPFEMKTILGPLDRDLVLTDVIFDLYNHPNGAASKACGDVWNVLPNRWSRLLLGGTVDDRGRRYSLQSGILCPQGSHLSISSCFFVSEPTAMLSARVTGCFCTAPIRPPIRFDPGPVATLAWDDGLPAPALDPLDPTGRRSARERTASFPVREMVATASDAVAPGDVLVHGADRDVELAPGDAVAVGVSPAGCRWSGEGARQRVTRGPNGTNLIVARRSPDGRLIHWAMYRESAIPTKGRARARA